MKLKVSRVLPASDRTSAWSGLAGRAFFVKLRGRAAQAQRSMAHLMLRHTMGWLSRLKDKHEAAKSAGLNPESSFIVAVTDEGVTCSRSSGLVESVTWDDLKEVSIVTNDEGPIAIDVMWLLVGERGGCVVPQGATGQGELLTRLQGLEGFRNDAMIEAMSSVTNRKFLCWQKQLHNAS